MALLSSRSTARFASYTYFANKFLPTLKKALPSLPATHEYALPTVPLTGNYQTDLATFEKAIGTQGLRVTEIPTYTQLSPLKTILSGIVNILPVATGAGAVKFGASSTLTGLAPDASKSTLATTGGLNMGLFDDIWGGIQSAATNIFPTNQGIDWNNVLNQGIGLATTALAPRYSAPPMPTAQPTSLAGAVPRAMIGAGGAVVARGFFNRFPNLATAIQTLRNGGMNVTRSKLYGVMKRFGPEFLVTGGLLTAAAVNELAVAGPGYRRMNPANVRALRRSVRRIESFHRLCTTTDRLRGRKRGRKC